MANSKDANGLVPRWVLIMLVGLAVTLSSAVWAFSNGAFATKDYAHGIDARVKRNTDDIRSFYVLVKEGRAEQRQDFREFRAEQKTELREIRRLIEKRSP